MVGQKKRIPTVVVLCVALLASIAFSAKAINIDIEAAFDFGNYDEVRRQLTAHSSGTPKPQDYFQDAATSHATRLEMHHLVVATDPRTGPDNTDFQAVIRSIDMDAPVVATPTTLAEQLWAEIAPPPPPRSPSAATTGSAVNVAHRKIVRALLHLSEACAPQNAKPHEGVRMLRELATEGNAHALYWLGKFQIDGTNNIPKNFFEGIERIKRAGKHSLALLELQTWGVAINKSTEDHMVFDTSRISEATLAEIRQRIEESILTSVKRHTYWRRCWSICSNFYEFTGYIFKSGAAILAFVGGGTGDTTIMFISGGLAVGGLALDGLAKWASKESDEHTTKFNAIARDLGLHTLISEGNPTIGKTAAPSATATSSAATGSNAV